MSVTVRPISHDETEDLILGLCSQELHLHELGDQGQWYGRECEHKLGLVGDVRIHPLANLLDGLSPSREGRAYLKWRGKDEPAGWVATFEVNRGHRTLWAVGDGETRKIIEVIHEFAVKSALDLLDSAVRKHAGFGSEDMVGAAYAIFQSGVGPGQTPGLHSSVIIPQGHRREFGSFMTFPPTLIPLARPLLDLAYESKFLPRAYHVFGRIGFGKAIIPTGLFKPLLADPDVTVQGLVEGEDIFTQWRRQARARGFGPDQIAEVLHSAREEAWKIGKPKDFKQPMDASAIRSITEELLKCCLGDHQPGRSERADRQEGRGGPSPSISI